MGLLCAALRHFAAQQPSCKLIACTHFSEVLDEHYLARHVSHPYRKALKASPCGSMKAPHQGMSQRTLLRPACDHKGAVSCRHPQLAFYTMEVLTGPQKAAHSSQQQEIVFLYHLGQGDELSSLPIVMFFPNWYSYIETPNQRLISAVLESLCWHVLRCLMNTKSH